MINTNKFLSRNSTSTLSTRSILGLGIIRSDSKDAFDLKIGEEVNSEWKAEKILAFDLDGKSLPLNK